MASVTSLGRQLPPLTPKTILISTTLLLAPAAFIRLRTNYRAYLANGRGGLPYNVFGWALQWALRLVAKTDKTSLEPYDNPKRLQQYGSLGQGRFLQGELRPREGGRPEILPWVAPHRQAQPNGPAVRKLQREAFDQLAALNPDVVQVRRSAAEQHEDALWLAEGIPVQPWAERRIGGECAHVHLSVDGSCHVTLSMADAREVVGKGYGERHGLSGVILPWGNTLLYAPRDAEEVEVMKRIFAAGVRFMAGGEMEVREK